MSYREARIYDREFPSAARIMVGDPTVKDEWPEEVWKAAVGKDEFAVVFRHCQTDHLLMPDGKLAKQGSELCLIFDNLDEAQAYSRQLVGSAAHTVCCVYNDAGVETERIRNQRVLNRSAMLSFWPFCFGLQFWVQWDWVSSLVDPSLFG